MPPTMWIASTSSLTTPITVPFLNGFSRVASPLLKLRIKGGLKQSSPSRRRFPCEDTLPSILVRDAGDAETDRTFISTMHETGCSSRSVMFTCSSILYAIDIERDEYSLDPDISLAGIPVATMSTNAS